MFHILILKAYPNMKRLTLLLSSIVLMFVISAYRFQGDKDYSSSEKINKLAGEIKLLLDKYPTAIATYKGKEIKDTSTGSPDEATWFRSKTRFTLATKAVLEYEEESYTLYLRFEGFSSNAMAVGFASRLKQKLLQADYVFGKLETVGTINGFTPLLPAKEPQGKYQGIMVDIEAPDPLSAEDKFGNKRDKDVVITIGLPSK
jgi:hypothetical protein